MEESQFSSYVGSEGNRVLITEDDSMDVQCLDEEDPIGIEQDYENYLTSNEAGHKNLLDWAILIPPESDVALAAAATEHSSSNDKSVATTGTSAVKSKNVFENSMVSMEIVTRVPLDEELSLSLNNVSIDEADKQIRIIKMTNQNAINNSCRECCKVKKCMYQVNINSEDTTFICDNICLLSFRKLNNLPLQKSDPILEAKIDQILPTLHKSALDRSDPALKFNRKCAECSQQIKSDDVVIFSWEIMEFCKVYCLSQYQKRTTSNCSNCKKPVPTDKAEQYCDIRQFCTKICMNKYSKINLPLITPLPVNTLANKQQCSVCIKNEKVQVYFDEQNKNCKHAFCSNPCFVAFKFVHQINPPQCSMCKNFFKNDNLMEFTIFYNNLVLYFCCKTCQNIYIIRTRKIMPCNNCAIKKFDFDMIKKITNDLVLMFCSLNCLNCYQVATNIESLKKLKCKFCTKVSEARYCRTMSDGTIQNFCTNNCLLSSQNQLYNLPATVGSGEKSALVPMKVIQVPESNAVMQNTSQFGSNSVKQRTSYQTILPKSSPASITKQQIIIQEPPLPLMKNASTLCKPIMHTKSVSCCPVFDSKETQTEKTKEKINFIPLPVPIYVPAPLPMFSAPVPVPIPFPVPVPIPTFIPVTRKSADRIKEDLKKTSEMILPNDPFELELLEMAKLIAVDEKIKNTDSEKDENGDVTAGSYDDDVLQVVNDVDELLGDIADKTANINTVPLSLDNSSVEPIEDQQNIPTDNCKDKTTNRITFPLSLDNSPVQATEIQQNISTDNYKDKIVYRITFPQSLDNSPVEETENQQNIPIDNCKDKTVNRITFPLSLDKSLVEATENQQNIPIDNCKDKTVNRITVPLSLDNAPVEGTENQQNIPTDNYKRKKYQPTYRNLAKRCRLNSSLPEIPILPLPSTQQSVPKEPETTNVVATVCPLTKEKNLKYNYCVNIWKDWVTEKNKFLKKSSRHDKLIKTDLLQITEIELNYYLCLFINEIKKTNGSDYRPDTIYYICLGIQKYLRLNGKKYNIFTDKYFDKFTDYIDEKAKKFFELYKNSDHISTRIEEEHLWETNQLGAHSPIVLVNTLMYFNTKYFCLSTLDEHMQLSFHRVIKHYNRISKNERNILLRYYPINSDSTFKKLYQYENKENPFRCPVKLYDFYLTKCPKEVQTRENLFYLQPERSCEPDSPLWYSSMALDQRTMEKMLNRLKITTEINIALFAPRK